MKIFNFLFIAVMMLLPSNMNAQRIQQTLGRGVVAVKRSGTSLDNNTSTTSALVTAANGGMVVGTGTTANVTVNKGGTVGAGKANSITVGTLNITGNLNVQNGGTIRVRGRSARSVDDFKVAGKVTLNNPLFRMERLSDDWATDTDYKVFTGTGTITITGTPTFEPTVPMEGYLWDYSALASDGILRVVADPTGIEEITEEELRNMDVYDLNGRKQSAVNFKKGIYIINGKKYLVK